MRKLQEKVLTLESDIKISSYFSGPVDPPSSQSSSKTPKSQDCVSRKGLNFVAEGFTRKDEKTYSVLDSFVQTNAGYCKCQRGPVVSSLPSYKI